jgi:hypothetical protein
VRRGVDVNGEKRRTTETRKAEQHRALEIEATAGYAPGTFGKLAEAYIRVDIRRTVRIGLSGHRVLAVRDDAVEGAGAGCSAPAGPPESFQWQKWPTLEPRAAGSARCHADHAAGRREEPSRDPAAAPLKSALRGPDPQ